MGALLQRLDDLSGLGIHEGSVLHHCGGSQTGSVILHLFSHGINVLLLGSIQTADHLEHRLTKINAGCTGSLAETDLGNDLIRTLATGKEGLHILGESLQRPGRQIQSERENLIFTEQVQHTAVLAGFALALTAAELVKRTVLADTAGSAGSVADGDVLHAVLPDEAQQRGDGLGRSQGDYCRPCMLRCSSC